MKYSCTLRQRPLTDWINLMTQWITRYTRCSSCTKESEGTHHYCPVCAQSAVTHFNKRVSYRPQQDNIVRQVSNNIQPAHVYRAIRKFEQAKTS